MILLYKKGVMAATSGSGPAGAGTELSPVIVAVHDINAVCKAGAIGES